MSEEQTLQASELAAPETGAADDYFSGHTELIDDDGNTVSSEETEKLESKPTTKPTVSKPNEAPAQQEESLREIPDGFESRFFDKTEKGEVAFKGEDAVKFLFPEGESPTRFKYQPINVVPEDLNAAKPEANVEPAWKKELQAEKEYRKNLRDNLTSPLKLFRDALRQGHKPEEALALAEQQTITALEEHLAERQYELEAKRREQLENEGMTKAEMAELKQRAATNEAIFYNEVGGKEAFDKLFFGGVSKDGKPQPGIGAQDIWMLFKMNNPDLQTNKITSKQLNEKMSNWWTRFASNQENLAFAYKIVRGTLTEKMRPYLIDKIRTTAQSQIASNREGAIKRNMGINPKARTAKSEKGNGMLDAYLNPMASRDDLASV